MADENKKINIRLKSSSLEKLKQIILSDYGVELNNAELEDLCWSLLKITQRAMNVFNRVEQINSIIIIS